MSTNESLFDFGDDKDHSKSRSSCSKSSIHWLASSAYVKECVVFVFPFLSFFLLFSSNIVVNVLFAEKCLIRASLRLPCHLKSNQQQPRLDGSSLLHMKKAIVIVIFFFWPLPLFPPPLGPTKLERHKVQQNAAS